MGRGGEGVRGRGEGGCYAWAFSKVKEHFILCVYVCVFVQICSVCVRQREREREKGDRAVERGWRELQRVRGI